MIQDKIRIGIIGAGQNTRKMHIPKLLALPGIELTEVANRTIESAKKVSKNFNIKRIRSNWQEVTTSNNVDAIVIGTWPYLHCEATCAALNSGKHVLCEARMAMNFSESQQMLKTSRGHSNLTSQVVPAPFTLHSDKTIRSYIDEDRLGKILYFHADYQTMTMQNDNSTLHWRRNKKYSGENTMVLGIIYESIQRWIPPAIKLSATGNIFNDKSIDPETGNIISIEIPDYLLIQMEMENNIRGSFLISEVGLHSPTPTITIHGTKGSLKVEFIQNGKLWYGTRMNESVNEVPIKFKDRGFWRVEEEFINTIKGIEKTKLTTFKDGVDYMRFTQAVMDSYRENGITKYL